MNLAHIIGEHANQTFPQNLLHGIVSWLPIIGAVFTGLLALVAIARSRSKLSTQRVKVGK